MALESGTFVSDLQQTNPPGTDKKKQGDDHLRLIKTVLRNTFPNGSRAQYFARSRAVTVGGAIAATDMAATISADATAGNISLSLPSLAAGDDGWAVRVFKSDASANTVTATGTVNGVSGFTLSRQFEAGLFIWGGSAWFGVRERPFIVTGDIQDNSITNAKMADDAINTAEIVNVAVTSGKLADNSILTAKVVDANITNPKLVGPRRTTQRFLSGTAQTYTTPANCKSLIIRMIGGGGGSAGNTGTNGGTGGTTTFNSVNANGGTGGQNPFTGGIGGTGGTGSASLRIAGGDGGQVQDVNYGPNGGSGFFGGAGRGEVNGGGTSSAGKANSGGGAGGGKSGGAGAAGEYVEIDIQSPAATYVYSVGAGGTAGSGGAAAVGGDGIIIVEEYY